jgi:hypothetical protein
MLFAVIVDMEFRSNCGWLASENPQLMAAVAIWVMGNVNLASR